MLYYIIHPPVANFLQCICAKNYENRLAVDKVIVKIIRLTFFGPPCSSQRERTASGLEGPLHVGSWRAVSLRLLSFLLNVLIVSAETAWLCTLFHTGFTQFVKLNFL